MYPLVFGKYVLERELARGGMARVVLATLRGAGGFEKKLVVKQIRDELAFDSEWVRRFVEEAKTTVALSHPNIVPVYELGVEQGTYFLAMELVDGVTVAELLKHGGPLSPEEGAYVGVEVCRALDYAHRRMEVVHRDVTPRNVMVDEEGQIKVIDFGIAAPSEAPGQGGIREVFGSPGHMPPEQIAGDALGPATDIFAVAVTLIEAWSGKAAFRRRTAAESADAMRAQHPKPSDAHERLAPLDAVMTKALALDPASRPQSADELGKALRRFIAGSDTGDLARALGERVRATRALSAEKENGPTEASLRPPAPSLGDLGTRTFAARQEVGAWPKGQNPPSARKLMVPTPVTGIMVEPRTRRLPTSAPPPPLDAAPAPPETKPEPAPIETVATASIERVVRPKPERSRLVLWASGALAIAAALLAVRLASSPSASPPSQVSPSPPAAPAPIASAGPDTPPTPAPNANPNANPNPNPNANANANPNPNPNPNANPNPNPNANPTPTPNANPTPNAPPSPTILPSHLSLVGDLGTHVSVDGVPRGVCPIRDLSLEPGPHDVRFTFDPTGESSGEHLTLRAGEHVTVRADFSSATPTLRVKRP